MAERRTSRQRAGDEPPERGSPEKRDERARDEQDSSGKQGRRAARRLTAPQAAQAALRAIVELTGKQPEGVTEVEPTDDGWLVGVEVVEDRRVPSSADVLATYRAQLEPDGSLVSYRRGGRYSRGRGDNGGGG